MQPRLLLISLLICCLTNVSAQQDTTSEIQYKHTQERHRFIGILLGYNYYNRNSAEIGIGKAMEAIVGHHGYSTVVYAATEVATYNKQVLWGPKIGVQSAGGCCGGSLGAALIYYIHPEATSLKIRPEIGIGFTRFRMFYGAAFSITNKDFWPISKQMFGINFMIKAKEIKDRPQNP